MERRVGAGASPKLRGSAILYSVHRANYMLKGTFWRENKIGILHFQCTRFHNIQGMVLIDANNCLRLCMLSIAELAEQKSSKKILSFIIQKHGISFHFFYSNEPGTAFS
jgi:hypothetical protein